MQIKNRGRAGSAAARGGARAPARRLGPKIGELGARSLLFASAAFSVVAVFFIIAFLFRESWLAFTEVGPGGLLGGDYWNPRGHPPSYGAYPLIVGSLLVTLGAMLFAVPIGVGSAIFISELAPPRIRLVLKSLTEILSGIPSVVYGFFGLLVLTNWLRVTFNQPTGESWLAGSILLGIMALPIIVSVSEDALSSVPREYREASCSVGATRWQTISGVVVPSALSGITAAIVLGMGRAVGETMAVMMVTGNTGVIPDPITNLFSPIRTITGTVAIEMGEVEVGSVHYSALFALCVILFIITLVINGAAKFVLSRLRERFEPAARRRPRGRGALRALLSRLLRRLRPAPLAAARLWPGRAARALGALVVLWLLVSWWGWLWGSAALATLAGLLMLWRRSSAKSRQRVAFGLLTASIVTLVFLLSVILYYIIINGLPALSWEFLTQPPRDVGRSGGIYPAIVGTLLLVAGALAIAVPIGVGAGIYLSEYAREGAVTRLVRSSIDSLNGTPSIVFGLFGLAFLVVFLGLGVSMIAGQLTLAFMILPTIIRTTEESLKVVPVSMREGSLAVGATRWQTIRRVVLPSAAPGVITGVVLGMGRAAGETAPILFTAAVFYQRFLPETIFDPVMALPYHLFVLSTNVPGSGLASAGTALVLLLMVLPMYAAATLLRHKYARRNRW
ncbi:MAG: phosphate ABC transporter permease subunit PstC [Thermoplasmatota archaeon]